jgi:TetR/AcrR family transcriptional regulator
VPRKRTLPRRAAGRPPQPAPESRELILHTAERLFARQGFGPTTVKQIATEAGLNVALIYYYFRDKEGLYHSVLERIVNNLIQHVAPALSRGGTPGEAIAELVRLQARVLLDSPNVPRLMVREMVDHDASHAKPYISRLAANLFTRLCETIEHGQKRGEFRTDLDPRFAAISTLSQMVYFAIAQPAVRMLLAREDSDDSLRSAFTAHAASFALAALHADTSHTLITGDDDTGNHSQADGA